MHKPVGSADHTPLPPIVVPVNVPASNSLAGVAQPTIMNTSPSQGWWNHIKALFGVKSHLSASSEKTVRVAFNQPKLGWRAKWVLHQFKKGNYKSSGLSKTSKVIVRDALARSLDAMCQARTMGSVKEFWQEAGRFQQMLELLSTNDASELRNANDDLGYRVKIFESGVLDNLEEDLAMAGLMSHTLRRNADPSEILNEAIELRKKLESLPLTPLTEVTASRADAIQRLIKLEKLIGLDSIAADIDEFRSVLAFKPSMMTRMEHQRFERVLTRLLVISKHHPDETMREAVDRAHQELSLTQADNYRRVVRDATNTRDNKPPRSQLIAENLSTPKVEGTPVPEAPPSGPPEPSVEVIPEPFVVQPIPIGKLMSGESLLEAMYKAGGPQSLEGAKILHNVKGVKHEIVIHEYDPHSMAFWVTKTMRNSIGDETSSKESLSILEIALFMMVQVKASSTGAELLESLGDNWLEKLMQRKIVFKDSGSDETRHIEILQQDADGNLKIQVESQFKPGIPIDRTVAASDFPAFLAGYKGSDFRLVEKQLAKSSAPSQPDAFPEPPTENMRSSEPEVGSSPPDSFQEDQYRRAAARRKKGAGRRSER